MLNQNKVQEHINSAYFDEISQIQVKNVQLDFQVCRLFSEYQMPPKKPKLKTLDSIKNKTDHKKTSESTISTKQRSKNQDDSNNLEKQYQNQPKPGNHNSLKKNLSKKVLFVENQQKAKVGQTTVKKTARKKTIFSEFQRASENDKKHIKSPEVIKISRKVSKAKQIPEKYKIGPQNKRSQHDRKNQEQTRKSRQSIDSNKNLSSLKKSRSESIMSGSRKRLSSKMVPIQKVDKLKEDNRKIIMRDYFGEDEQETEKKKTNGKAIDARNKRSTSKSNKDIMVARQRVESKSKQILTVKSRQRVGSKSKDRVLVFSSKNRCL